MNPPPKDIETCVCCGVQHEIGEMVEIENNIFMAQGCIDSDDSPQDWDMKDEPRRIRV